VVDASNPNFPEQMAEVHKVLAEIGAAEVPQVLVFNKLDAVPEAQRPHRLSDLYSVDDQPIPRFFVSARSGEGLGGLREHLAHCALQASQDLEG
jgi:GTP-binding protein HflX